MGVASVRRPGSTPDPINSVRRPDSISICPRTAIMAPLSTHNPLGGATQVAPAALSFRHPSAAIAGCKPRHHQGGLPSIPCVPKLVLRLRCMRRRHVPARTSRRDRRVGLTTAARRTVSRPENARSIPRTAYGSLTPSMSSSGWSSTHALACRSIAGPAGNAMPNPRPNLSSMFPIPMSSVSPRTR